MNNVTTATSPLTVPRQKPTLTHKVRSRVIVAILAPLLSLVANAQGIRVVADTITANSTSDKLYLTLGGTSTFQSRISIPNIHPSGQDFWSTSPGNTIQGIYLYEGFLGNGQRAVLAVAARAHHDCDFLCWLSDIGKGVIAVVDGIGAILTLDPGLAVTTVGALASTIDSFANSLQGDATIGAFGLYAANSGGKLTSAFVPSSTGRLLSQSGNSYVLDLVNNGFSYTVTLHLEQFHGSPIRNVNSNLCIDVPSGSLQDGQQVQQYPCNGGLNQSWLSLSINNAFPVVLVNENSGKCLDVRPDANGNFTADHDAIQQFQCHFGGNQQWMSSIFFGPFTSGGWEIVNIYSNKCIDVPWGSLSPIYLQQYTCNFTAGNQQWTPPVL